MKSVLVGTLALCIAGCGKSNPQPLTPKPQPVVVTPVVTKPVVEEQPAQKRTDLPVNWHEVQGNTWSYGIPMGFDPIKHETDIAAAHVSLEKELTITLDTEPAASGELADYVTVWLMAAQVTHHKEVLATMRKAGEDGPILASQLFWQTGDGKNITSLEFFVEKNKIIYHLSCESDNVVKFKQTTSNICFDIMDTFKAR